VSLKILISCAMSAVTSKSEARFHCPDSVCCFKPDESYVAVEIYRTFEFVLIITSPESQENTAP